VSRLVCGWLSILICLGVVVCVVCLCALSFVGVVDAVDWVVDVVCYVVGVVGGGWVLHGLFCHSLRVGGSGMHAGGRGGGEGVRGVLSFVVVVRIIVRVGVLVWLGGVIVYGVCLVCGPSSPSMWASGFDTIAPNVHPLKGLRRACPVGTVGLSCPSRSDNIKVVTHSQGEDC